jgi:cytidylate kinase
MAIITVSRGTFSGGIALAECLSAELGYRLLSRRELLTDAAKAFAASEDQLRSALTHKPGFLEGGRLERIHYVYCVQAVLAKEVQGDNVVYQGQAGHLLLHGIPHHLRLKVVADMEYRIKGAMERGHLKRDVAVERIKELDEERDRWVSWVYGADRNDPTTYDLVVNLEHIPISSACEIVVQAVNRDFQSTAQSQQAVDDLVLSSDIQARIGLDRSINCERIEVEASDGVVTVSGTVRTMDDADNVRKLVSQVPGVKDINSRMATRWY